LGYSTLCETPQVKYAVIKKHSNTFAIKLMCRVLAVSTAGFYAWRNRPLSTRAQATEKLDEKIKQLFAIEKGRSGSPRIKKSLKNEGFMVSENKVAERMKFLNLRAKAAKKYKATTNSNHSFPVADNLLQQDFSASRADAKWVTDITYIWTEEGWLYLATVLDCFTRKLIGWSLGSTMTKKLVCDALLMALWRRKMPTDVIVHSDRGSQYCSYAYQKLLKKNSLVCSMSKRGDCYDNAMMESWNHSFKVECIHGEKFITRDEAKKEVFEYIESYYNRTRLHSALGYVSPEQFETALTQKVA